LTAVPAKGWIPPKAAAQKSALPLFTGQPLHKIGLSFEQRAFVDRFEFPAVAGDFDEPVKICRFVAFAFLEG